jgi:hypothetical protein
MGEENKCDSSGTVISFVLYLYWNVKAKLNSAIYSDLMDEKTISDHLCGLLVRVPGYRSRGPGSIPGATRFSEK